MRRRVAEGMALCNVTLHLLCVKCYFHEESVSPDRAPCYPVGPMRWLTLLISLPASPTRHRVAAWRKLRRMGAVNLRGAAWILPETSETTELLQWLVQEIRSVKGEATLLHVDQIEPLTDEQLRRMFDEARVTDYQPVIRGCWEVVAQLDRHRAAPHTGLEGIKTKAETIKRELDRVRAIDYFESTAGDRARAAWEALAKRLAAAESRQPPASRRRRADLPPPGSTWVTRPRPHIDRIASAWLIKRFVDPQARFAFADPADAAKKGIPFDILGAEFGHQGEDCTFETLLKRFALKDRRLQAIAEIVHEADLHDDKFARTETTGVDLALRGLASTIHDDHVLLDRGMGVFDGLYAAVKRQ